MELPVTLPLRSSPSLNVVLILAHVAAATALALLRLAIPWKLVLGLFIALSLLRCLRRRQPESLTLKRDGTLEVDYPGQPRRPAAVLPATAVFPWLVVLVLNSGGKRQSLTLPVDAVGREGHRRLRLWLKWMARA